MATACRRRIYFLAVYIDQNTLLFSGNLQQTKIKVKKNGFIILVRERCIKNNNKKNMTNIISGPQGKIK